MARAWIGILLIPLFLASCGGDGDESPATGAESSVRALSEALPLKPPKNIAVEADFPSFRLSWEVDLPGDYNGDGTTSGADLFRISSRFMQSIDEEPDNACIDGNSDGVIDGRDLFLISTNFNNSVESFNVYRRKPETTAEKINDQPIDWAVAEPPACSDDYLYVDDDGALGELLYSLTSVGTGGESGPSDETAVDSAPMTLTLEPEFSAYTIQGTELNPISLTATVEGATPSEYGWVTSAGQMLTDTTTEPANTLLVDWRDAEQTVEVTVTAFLQDWEVNAGAQVEIAVLSGPRLEHFRLNGWPVDHRAYAGEVAAGETFHVSSVVTDGDGGNLSYSWSADGSTWIETPDCSFTNMLNSDEGALCTVTLLVEDDNGGEPGEFWFTCQTTTAGSDQNILTLTALPSPEDPDNKIRVEVSQNHLNRLSSGVTIEVYYDQTKLMAVAGDAGTSEDNPYGYGIPLYTPHYYPSLMVYSAFGTSTQPGPVFWIDYTIIGGRGTMTEFTFNEQNSVFSDKGTEFWQADQYVNAQYEIQQ